MKPGGIFVGILAPAFIAPAGMEQVEAQQKATCEAKFERMDVRIGRHPSRPNPSGGPDFAVAG